MNNILISLYFMMATMGCTTSKASDSSASNSPSVETPVASELFPMIEGNKTSSGTEIIDAFLLEEIKRVLSSHFSADIQIKSVVQLTEESRRNRVLRLNLHDSNDGPKSLILKQSQKTQKANEGEEKGVMRRFARDAAGLEFLSSLRQTTPIAPAFFGASSEYRFVLLEDLGDKHTSLVDALTSDDPKFAREALHRYVKAMSQLHGLSHENTENYNEMLLRAIPASEIMGNHGILDEDFSGLSSILKNLDVRYTEEMQAEVTNVLKGIKTGPFTTFIHGDICPDNVFDQPAKGKMILIDFEWGVVGSALLDATYLRMSMPTCWCAKEFPEEIISSLEVEYRNELTKLIPAANDDNLYFRAYSEASAFWMLESVAMINDVLKSDHVWGSAPMPEGSLWQPSQNQARPRILSRLEAFISISKTYNTLPQIRNLAEMVLDRLHRLWPEVKRMTLFPAFAKSQ